MVKKTLGLMVSVIIVMLFVFITNANAGLIGYWMFDEATAGVTPDATTNDNDGTLEGDAKIITDPDRGKVLSLDGTGDYVDVGDDSIFTFSNGTADTAFSIAAWVKMTDASKFPTVTKGVYSASEQWMLGVQSTDVIRFWTGDNSENSLVGRNTDAVTAYEGAWTHFAAVYDGTGATGTSGYKIYINGTELSTTDYLVNGDDYVTMEDGAEAVHIGRYSSYYANGLIDDVRIYDEALDKDAIDALVNPSVIPEPSALLLLGGGLLGLLVFSRRKFLGGLTKI